MQLNKQRINCSNEHFSLFHIFSIFHLTNTFYSDSSSGYMFTIIILYTSELNNNNNKKNNSSSNNNKEINRVKEIEKIGERSASQGRSY